VTTLFPLATQALGGLFGAITAAVVRGSVCHGHRLELQVACAAIYVNLN